MAWGRNRIKAGTVERPYRTSVIARVMTDPPVFRAQKYTPLARWEPSKTTACLPAARGPSSRRATSLPSGSVIRRVT